MLNLKLEFIQGFDSSSPYKNCKLFKAHIGKTGLFLSIETSSGDHVFLAPMSVWKYEIRRIFID